MRAFAVGLSLAFMASPVAAGQPKPLFASDDTIQIAVQGPLNSFFRNRTDTPRQGSIIVGNETLPVSLSVRGITRRMSDTCDFPPLRVEFTAVAAQHVREAEEWWRLNRSAAPNAVREELQRLLPIIATQPRIGLRATNVKLDNVRRIHIPRISYHIYFHLTGAPEFLEILALWHSRRGSGPPI